MSKRWLATRTLEAVDNAIARDSGSAYRVYLGQVLPHMGDAYRAGEDGYRTHLGASVVGGECARAVAYGWHWALKRPPRGRKGEDGVHAHSRMARLWNRGHLEEARFIACLLAAGIQVYQQTEDGNQFRISAFGGHFGGSTDGVLLGVPDLPPGIPCLAEFKTHGSKSFKKLEEDGVLASKETHYVQMQLYMGKRGLQYALYLAVNKDTDDLYAEIVRYDGTTDAAYLERARSIIFDDTLPQRIKGASPGFHVCKYLCDFKDVCFHTVKPDRNCRTCAHWRPLEDGTSVCTLTGAVTDKAAQVAGCASYELSVKLR